MVLAGGWSMRGKLLSLMVLLALAGHAAAAQLTPARLRLRRVK
jgi:hypothetical protein